MKGIAVTGGLACGKSSVCRIFKELGAYVISADAIVHSLLEGETGEQVGELLGEDVMTEGRLDRKKIGAAVFDNPKRLQQLERLLHPAVFEEISHQQQIAEQRNAPLFVVEIPLLFETGSEADYDLSIAVLADREVAMKRFGEDFERRSAHQLSNEEKGQRADLTIHNNGTLDELQREVKTIFNTLVRAQ